MATFIPEWTKVSGRDLHIKRALNLMDDAHVVRRPIRASACVADIFLQHRFKGWLAIAVENVSFEEIDPHQLFDSERRQSFEARLDLLAKFTSAYSGSTSTIQSLVLLWACSAEQARVLTGALLRNGEIRFMSREEFLTLGIDSVSGQLSALCVEDEERLLGTYFPEAQIPNVCTARRNFRRDNSAKLDRYFLDVEQEWASKLDLDMPEEQTSAAEDFSVRLINGVAGSGKTLIALNRALLLAEMYPTQSLLMLIHNTPIVADIKHRLHRAKGGLPSNLEITTFYGWACRQWRRTFDAPPLMPNGARVVQDLVNRHRKPYPDLRNSDLQLIDEIDFINQTLILDEASYLDASRAGRGFALRPKERGQVWAVYTAVTESLWASRLKIWSAIPREICLAQDRHARLAKHHHILVDEAQFFAPSWFQLVKLSLKPNGQLFLCADPNQGFMKSRLSWKSVGLDVAGRTKKLRRSYRTTKSLLEAATKVLAEHGKGDTDDYLEPDFDGMDEGVMPVLIHTDSPQDSMDRLVNEVVAATSGEGLPLSAVLVIYGDNVNKSGLYSQLDKRLGGGAVWWFNEKDQKKVPPRGHDRDYLRMAYLDSATGLEGSVVFLIGVENLFAGDDVIGSSEDEKLERREENSRKLYMAMTLAGQRLVVLSAQRLPEAMERIFAKA